MAKTMKLKAALDRQKGVNHKLEKQKKQQKEAEKRKRAKQQPAEAEAGGDGADGEQDVDFAALENVLAGAEVVEVGGDDDDAKVDRRQKPSKGNRKERRAAMLAAKAAAEAQEITNGATVEDVGAKGDAEGWETDESEGAENDAEVGAMSDESESDSEIENDPADNDEDEAEEEDEDEEDIALSDLESLASEDKEDVVPHQRLTINNTAALARSLKSFALPASLPFSAVQAITSEDPVDIPDVEDDLNRELAFYRQSLNAVTEARVKLKAEGVSFSRPTDYFAEMVKSEEQMGKVRAKLLDETARKKASSDARRQRDLKKFGKQVQVAKLQERQKEKTATLDRIQTLKRKRQGADLATNETDPFDVALEDAATTAAKDKADRRAKGDGARKRQKKDEKFGFGGKKRFGKSNDAKSAADDSGYSVRKMKSGGKGKPRPGKSKRSRA
ncbi:putative rRNA-processing protein [Sphaerulina musiva]